eukprot:gi/632969256/ref/XP_007900989.1/ PREDICTED: myomegalin-like isoform X3 [Callorhinchus milii]
MKDLCRVCASRLQGNQRRWIFSIAGKRRLQVVLSFVLDHIVNRDGEGEFLCSKCVFMLEKVFKCDIVIAHVRALAVEKLQSITAEKEQLIQCISRLYYRYNKKPPGPQYQELSYTPEAASLPRENYSRLLQAEFSLYEYEHKTPRKNSNGRFSCSSCRHAPTRGHRMRKCFSYDLSRVTDCLYDSVYSTPRWSTRGGRSGSARVPPLSRQSPSMCFELIQRSSMLAEKESSGLSLKQSLCAEISESPSLASLNLSRIDWKIDEEPEEFQLTSESDCAALGGCCLQMRESVAEAIQQISHFQCKPVPFQSHSKIPIAVYSARRPASGCSSARTPDLEGARSVQKPLEDMEDEYIPLKTENLVEKHRQFGQLEMEARQLNSDLERAQTSICALQEKLKEAEQANKILQEHVEEKKSSLTTEKQNSLKRDKTIQGLTLALKAKEKEIEELCHEIEDRDDALAKARDSLHKAQLQKFQGAEEYQSLLTEKETELAELRVGHNGKAMETQKLQRALNRQEQELNDLNQAKGQLERELEDMHLQKNKGDKAVNELRNQLEKLRGELTAKEQAMEQQYKTLLNESKLKLQSQELVIERLTDSLNNKDQLLQDYMELAKGAQLGGDQSPSGKDALLAKLRDRLKEKDKALERAIDERYAAIDEKENEIRQLRLALREKEHDLDRLNSLFANNEETINSLDGVIKEKDMELQHLTNTCKNLQRVKQELEESRARALREKDAIISQLENSLKSKTQSLEEMTDTLLSQAQSDTKDLAEQLSQRLKVKEKMLEEAWVDQKDLSSKHEREVEDLLNLISNKDNLFKEASERYNRKLSDLNREIQELERQLADKGRDLLSLVKHDSMQNQEQILEMAQLKAALDEKDKIINKLVEHGQEKNEYFAQLKDQGTLNPPHVLELKQTIKILQEQLEEAKLTQHTSVEDEIVVKTSQSKKGLIYLKKELAKNTEELNNALKKENEAKMEVARLQSVLECLHKQIQAQAASIESLSNTMQVKDEIIKELQARLNASSEVREVEHFTSEVIVLKEGIQRPDHPPRERTIIGGDSQQYATTTEDELSEDQLYQALKAEQQLYSRLIKAVKEPDSHSRIQALQMELTAVQLLRQQLEESIRSNQDLQKKLEEQVQETKRKEATTPKMHEADLREMEALRHQLEDSQRWNASLQTRFGQMQTRGGGVGAANDSGDTFTTYGDQTSYLSICLGEYDSLEIGKLSLLELRQRVIDLQMIVKELQMANQELREREVLSERSILGSESQEKTDVPAMAAQINFLEQKLEESMKTITHLREQLQTLNQASSGSEGMQAVSKDDKCMQTSPEIPLVSEPVSGQDSSIHIRKPATGKPQELPASRSRSSSATSIAQTADLVLEELTRIKQELEDTSRQLQDVTSRLEMTQGRLQESEAERHNLEQEVDLMRSLLNENGVLSIPELRTEIVRLRSEVTVLRDGLGENVSEGETEDRNEKTEVDLRELVTELKVKLKNSKRVNDFLKRQVELNSSTEGENSFNPELIVNMAREIERLEAELEAAKQKRASMDGRAEEMKRKGVPQTNLPRSKSLELRTQQPKKTEEISDGSVRSDSSVTVTVNTRSRLPIPLKQTRSTSSVSMASSQDTASDNQQQVDRLKGLLKDCKLQNRQLQIELCTAEATISSQAEKLKLHCSPQAEASLEQDDKEVQVDFQDLGYETCGKSETEADRDESSSPDTASRLPGHHCSDSNIPSLLKLDRRFFSMENLDTNSSTSYPSSPSLISPKVSLKNLNVFDEYGQTDNTSELQIQIHELKAQIEKYQKIVHHLHARIRKNSLSSDQLTISDHSQQAKSSYEGQYLDPVQKEDVHCSSQRRHSIQSSDLSIRIRQKKGNHLDHMPRSQSMDFGNQDDRGSWSVSQFAENGEQMQQLKRRVIKLEDQIQKERAMNERLQGQLRHVQTKLAAASPARYDPLIQSQARDLSHLRQQIKESCNICTLHYQQLVGLTKGFEELLQASDVDYYIGEAFREQLDESLQLVVKLEGNLDNGEISSVGGDHTFLDLAQSPRNLQHEILYLRKQLESERSQLQKQLNDLLLQNQSLSQSTKEQLDQLTKEVQEKNKTICHLEQQLRAQSHMSNSHLSSYCEASDQSSVRSHESRSTTPEARKIGENLIHDYSVRHSRLQRRLSQDSDDIAKYRSSSQSGFSAAGSSTNLQINEQTAERKTRSGLSITPDDKALHPEDVAGSPLPVQTLPHSDRTSENVGAQTSLLNQKLFELQRENATLHDQLKSKEDLNETLRTELDLHRSILTEGQEGTGHQTTRSLDSDRSLKSNQQIAMSKEQRFDSGLSAADLLAEHLHEIRSLRERLDESIRNNDRLREQLERRLAEAERDPASTNIFIHGSEEHSHLTDKIHYLKEQNQALKEELMRGSRDKQRENEKLKESLSKRNVTIEHLRSECERVRREQGRLQAKASSGHEENKRLTDELHQSCDEINRLQRELALQNEKVTENQQLLKSLQVELRVYEQLREAKEKKAEPSQDATCGPAKDSQGPLDLSELLAEIRSLRIHLERSIQTNNALRQKLEEQLQKGSGKNDSSPSTININYLLARDQTSSGSRRFYQDFKADRSDAAGDGKETFQSLGIPTPKPADFPPEVSVTDGLLFRIPGVKSLPKDDVDSSSHCSDSSVENLSHKPARPVLGHRIWADKNGRLVVGLLEDYSALRKLISEGRLLIRAMDTRLRDCLNTVAQRSTGSKEPDEPFLKDFSSDISAMQRLLEEAGRFLKLFWRVSLPSPMANAGGQHKTDKIVKDEIHQLRKKLTEQERLLYGTVKRLRTTNQLKEGMEKVIIDQLSLTHNVLKTARGNLEVRTFEETQIFDKTFKTCRPTGAVDTEFRCICTFSKSILLTRCKVVKAVLYFDKAPHHQM